MKLITHFFRFFVGVLFIFSGMIKLNDPVGFSFKLEEYFGPTVLDLGFLIPLVLPMAISIVIFEVLVGVSLLIGFKKKYTLWSLLLMIIFFTFLTWYSAYFNKVTDCGCFGDAIKLTPWESFYKDIILLIMIVFMYFKQKFIHPIFNLKLQISSLLTSLIVCVFITYTVLSHLPLLDFRAYKVGNNIKDEMSIPEDAPKDVYEYNWEFLIDNKKQIITTTGDYPTVEGEFVDVTTKLIKRGYEPAIYDFSIEDGDINFTDEVLNMDKVIVIISYDLEKINKKSIVKIKDLFTNAFNNDYEIIGLTSSSKAFSENFRIENDLPFAFYTCDETALKTIVRSNPGVIVLEKGTIIAKKHFNDFDNLNFK